MNPTYGDLFQLSAAPNLLVVISGPSGVGKDAVLAEIKQHAADDFDFNFIVTTTSRPKRENEVDGRDYFFVSIEKFKEMIAADDFLEYALVYQQYKGISKTKIEEAFQKNQDAVLRIDVQGTKTVKSKFPQAVAICLLPENEAVLRQRLTERKTDTPEQVEHRLETARQEMAEIGVFDYVVVNRQGEISETVQEILTIIRAEKKKVDRLFK